MTADNRAADDTAYELGIDLGTTYVAAGILEQGRPEIITLGDRVAVLPSVLYFRDDGEVLTGEPANRRGLSDPTRVVREFKRRVGDTTPIVVGQTPYSVDVLMAKLLRFVHDAVVERQGGAPRSIVVTHPANWGPYKIDVLEQAVRLADIGDATTITEPVAAAIHYAAAERLQPGQTVAVYDLGGGTFDAAVLRKTDDAFTVLGEVEGIERLGGIDFDEAVFQHVVRFSESSLAELDMDDPTAIQALARLRQECVDAKEVLSTDTDVTIPVVLPNLQSEIRLTRTEFEAMIRPLIQQTVQALRRAVRSADIEPADLSAVLLVGGSSRIPLIAELVGAELGRPIAVDRHPKHTVALGAAISAGVSGEAPAPQVDDWFRSEPTSAVPIQDGPRSGTAAAAAGVAAAAASATDDPLSMFPLKGAGDAGDSPAGQPSPIAPATAGTAAEHTAGAAAKHTAGTATAHGAVTAAAGSEAGPGPVGGLGTAPIRFAAADAPTAGPATASPPQASAPSASPPQTSPPQTSAPQTGQAGSAAAAGSPLAGAAPAAAARTEASPILGGPAPDRPAFTSGQPAGGGHLASQAGPTSDGHQFRPSRQGSAPGGRIAVMVAGAIAAVLILGGGAWAALNLGGTAGGTDTTGQLAEGQEVIGQQDGNQQDVQGPTAATDRTGSTLDQSGGRGSGATQPTTGTTIGRDTTTTAGTTTAVQARQIEIVSGPRVNSRGDTSFQFEYNTNDVCGTGSFTVTEKATGQPAGSFQGDDGCFGPRHGGFPGHSSFPGFNLKPATTYTVTATVRGTASDGRRTAGTGTDRVTFEVTTTGTPVTTTTTSDTTTTTAETTTTTTADTETTADTADDGSEDTEEAAETPPEETASAAPPVEG